MPPEMQTLFSRVAPGYDRLNRVLSWGLDRSWRLKLAQEVRKQSPERVLDVATGSGDILLALTRERACGQPPVGIDVSGEMLALAERKGIAPSQLIQADALRLPFADNSYDAITVAFGLRNMVDRATALREWRRVLAPEGKLYVLEFSHPWQGVRPLHFLYLRQVVPRVAARLGARTEDYRYLAESIRAFPNANKLAEEIRDCGFSDVAFRRLSTGIVALHMASKPTG